MGFDMEAVLGKLSEAIFLSPDDRGVEASRFTRSRILILEVMTSAFRGSSSAVRHR